MEKMYTRKEAATLLGISITTLDQARSAGQITYVQYVDKITMDIYAKVKYNRPQELAAVVNSAFNKG